MEQVSVIITAYNISEEVGTCIESVLNQTYPFIEIIIVDDGSVDGTTDIISKYVEKNNRIISIRQENKGLSAARNTGVNISRGGYIFFVDGDDWLEPQCIEKMLGRMHETDADIVECGYYQKGKGVCQEYPKQYEILTGRKQILAEHLRKKISFLVWNKLYRSDLIKEIRFEEGAEYEDVLWTCEVLTHTEKIASVQQPLYNWRIRSGSISRRNFDERNFKALDHFYERSKKLESIPDKGIKALAKASCITQCYLELSNATQTKDIELIKKAREHSFCIFKNSLLNVIDFVKLCPLKSKMAYLYFCLMYRKVLIEASHLVTAAKN